MGYRQPKERLEARERGGKGKGVGGGGGGGGGVVNTDVHQERGEVIVLPTSCVQS